MRKLIIFSICIFSLTFSKTLLVPEEFLTIQSAVMTASNGDTVSVNFGRVNGQRTTVTTSRIFGKEITFEVRGEGKEELFDIFQRVNKLSMTLSDSGWTEQKIVNRLDSISDQQPHIAIDNLNYPWVVWRDGAFYDLSYTKWNGINWDEETGIMPYAGPTRFKPRMIFDNQDCAWVIYAKNYPNNTEDIFFTRKISTGWIPEEQINDYDSTELDFSPRIAYNGGQMWCVWYGGRTDTSQYHIYVSRWNGTSWDPETDISFPISPNDYGLHWHCDIVVDNVGHPHVVWGETWFTGRIYYRTYNGQAWLSPVILNNPDSIRCAGWPDLSITIDNNDNIHVSWVGKVVGDTFNDIFYNEYNGYQWSTPVRINQRDRYNDRWSDLIATSPNNVWATWEKQISFWEAYIYASHFDGNSWSEAERLDNRNISYCNGGCEMAKSNNNLWAIWDGFTVGIDHTDIYYSRHLNSSVNEQSELKTLHNPQLFISRNPFNENVIFSYSKNSSGSSELLIYDIKGRLIRTLVNQKENAGHYNVYWDGKDKVDKEIPEGIYFVLLKTEKKEMKKIIKIGG